MTYQGSPYEPKFRAVRADPSALPIARLRRLGLSEEQLSWAVEEWEAMGQDERVKTASRLALLTDDEARAALLPSDRSAPSTAKATKATKRTRKASG